MIRILIADNHELVRAGLRLLIDEQSDMTVVAEAATGNEALERARSVRPDVAVLDLTMPGIGGLGAVRALRASEAPTRIVILTRHSDDVHVRESLIAGTNAYVLKQSASHHLLAAIRAAARNEFYLDTALRPNAAPPNATFPNGTLPNGTPPNGTPPNAGSAGPAPKRRHDRVTPREEDVLRLAALGYANKEIAARLHISVRTVEVHKTNGMRKLDLRARADLVHYGMAHGWMSGV